MNPKSLRNMQSTVVNRQTAPALWLVETLWLLLASGVQTNNHFCALEQVMGAGLGPPAHRHPGAIEGFYLLEGAMTFHVDGQERQAKAGTLVHLPRHSAHTFEVSTPEARVLNFYAPAGNEMIVLGLAKPAEERRRPSMEESAPPKNPEQAIILQAQYGSEAVRKLPFTVPPDKSLLRTEAHDGRVGELILVSADAISPLHAFGLEWRVLASQTQTRGDYDLIEATSLDKNAGMPLRISKFDEALYIIDGMLTLTSDNAQSKLGPGSFAYIPAESLFEWHAEAKTRVLVFHVPGGFDAALVGGAGDEQCVRAWLEAAGTRFL